MAHSHHNHDHAPVLTNVNKAFIIGISLNFIFVIAEVVAGLITHSLSLLSDAGHNLADVGTLALSLLAFRLMKVKSNEHFSYGYRKTSILAALFNAVLLLVSIGAIIYEAIQRFLHPEPVPGLIISIVAGIGIFINATTALLFFRNKEKDINIKSAYLHLISDAVVSAALVVGGIVIIYTGWFWIDSALSVVVAIVILITSWGLLRDSLRLSLDAVPANVKIDKLKAVALKIDGVKDLHHIHVWAISTTENALTAHLVVNKTVSIENEQLIKRGLRHELLHQNVHHVTLETEWEGELCSEAACETITV